MRRFGVVAHRAARHTAAKGLLSPSSSRSSDPCQPRLHPHHLPSRFIITQSAHAPSGLPSRPQAAATAPNSDRLVDRQKRVRPSRVTDLYDALVYEDGGATRANAWRKVMAVDSTGSPVPDAESDLLRDRLEDCRQFAHAEQALAILDGAERDGRTPSARAIIMAIEACLPAEESALAETALKKLGALPVGHPARSARLITSARALIAVAYTARGLHEDALRVMGLRDYGSINWRQKEQVADRLDGLGLGRDTVAWGVLVKALTKLEQAEAAVDVVDIAMGRGVGMTDSLLHLTLDALRVLERPRQAEWLFDTAVRKGVKPRERTVASMLLTLAAKPANRSVNVARIEQLIDEVPDPSPRFMSTALLALTTAGSLQRSEQIFARMAQEGTPSEHSFAALMAGYGNHVDVGWEAGGAEEDTAVARAGMMERANEHWRMYLTAYGGTKPSAQVKRVRVALVHRYLRVKTRCCKLGESVDVLDQLAEDRMPGLEVTTGHISGVLGAAELACDVREMRRVVGVMERAGLRHDVRSLTFCIGTYLGDGNLGDALKLVRKEAPRLLADGYSDAGLRDYHWTLLGRRLEMLARAMKEAGGGIIKDLDSFKLIVNGKRQLP